MTPLVKVFLRNVSIWTNLHPTLTPPVLLPFTLLSVLSLSLRLFSYWLNKVQTSLVNWKDRGVVRNSLDLRIGYRGRDES